jgi:hypothetical protein
MKTKIDVLKLINDYSVQENSSSLDRIIEQHDFDELAEEVVKLFSISDVVRQSEQLVCDSEYDDFDTKDDLHAAGYDGDM